MRRPTFHAAFMHTQTTTKPAHTRVWMDPSTHPTTKKCVRQNSKGTDGTEEFVDWHMREHVASVVFSSSQLHGISSKLLPQGMERASTTVVSIVFSWSNVLLVQTQPERRGAGMTRHPSSESGESRLPKRQQEGASALPAVAKSLQGQGTSSKHIDNNGDRGKSFYLCWKEQRKPTQRPFARLPPTPPSPPRSRTFLGSSPPPMLCTLPLSTRTRSTPEVARTLLLFANDRRYKTCHVFSVVLNWSCLAGTAGRVDQLPPRNVSNLDLHECVPAPSRT